MRILVTGAAGWLGRHLIACLREAGHAPVGFDPAPSPWTDIVGDVADRTAVDAAFDAHRFDGVIHAGALHKPDIARYPQQAFIDVNVSGTLNLLEAASARGAARFVFTSTTSLMISKAIRDARGDAAIWLDETAGPLEPRNIYGVTKLAAEGLCRQHHQERALSVVILRTARFFPEDDDTIDAISGPNLKANELLNRRASVDDMARAHLLALESAPEIGFGLFLVSAPTPFERSDALLLKADAAAAVRRRFPDAAALYARAGWRLPASLDRVYDASLITRALGFRYATTFETMLTALRDGADAPVAHDGDYVSPLLGRS